MVPTGSSECRLVGLPVYTRTLYLSILIFLAEYTHRTAEYTHRTAEYTHRTAGYTHTVLCPSDCVYTRTVVSIHTDLMSIHIAPVVYTTDEYTHRSEIVHIGQTLYTSVENCTHRSKNVHIDLKNYTSI